MPISAVDLEYWKLIGESLIARLTSFNLSRLFLYQTILSNPQLITFKSPSTPNYLPYSIPLLNPLLHN